MHASPPPHAAHPRTQVAFCEHINHSLKDDEYLNNPPFKSLPMRSETDDLYRAVADGILLWCVLGRCCVLIA